jgi:hypothetical protein
VSYRSLHRILTFTRNPWGPFKKYVLPLCMARTDPFILSCDAQFAIITDTINKGRLFLFAPRLPNTGHQFLPSPKSRYLPKYTKNRPEIAPRAGSLPAESTPRGVSPRRIIGTQLEMIHPLCLPFADHDEIVILHRENHAKAHVVRILDALTPRLMPGLLS